MSDEEKKRDYFTLEKLKLNAKIEQTHDEVIEVKAELKQNTKETQGLKEQVMQLDLAIRGDGTETNKGIASDLRWLKEIEKEKKDTVDKNLGWWFAVVLLALTQIFELFGKAIEHWLKHHFH